MAYCLAVKWTIKEGELDAVLAALGPLTEASRAEPGCLMYQAHADSAHFKTHAVGEIFPRRESVERAEYETFEP